MDSLDVGKEIYKFLKHQLGKQGEWLDELKGTHSAGWLKVEPETNSFGSFTEATKTKQGFCFAEMTFAPVASDGNDSFGISKSRNIVAEIKVGRGAV